MTNITLNQLAAALGGEVRGGEVLAPGPGHSPRDRSLSVKLDDAAPGGFLVHSFSGDDAHACLHHVRQKVGIYPRPERGGDKAGPGRHTYSRVIAEYVYRDERGQPYLQVSRTTDKNFWQRHWDGKTWVKGKPAGPKIPYRLPQLLAAGDAVPVYIVEGEKDADNLAKLGFVTTTCSQGAGKWTEDLGRWFRNRNVFILPDNDIAGRQHAEQVARALHRVAATVRIVTLPDLPAKGDVSDWLDTDPPGTRLVRECQHAALWEPESADAGAGVIVDLAGLSPLEYQRRRRPAAKELGVGVGFLDREVGKARGETLPAMPDRWNVEPWPEPVPTADLLNSLRDTFNAYVVLPEHGAATMALWTLHTWAIDAAYFSPFLLFRSPLMRCGKTSCLTLLYRTCARTAMASNITGPALFRYVDAASPTLLIDEADSFFRNNEELRGILNSGHSREAAHVIRLVGENHEAREFSTWAAKAVASIGRLASTLHDRSIAVPMRRKKAREKVKKLSGRDSEEFVTLRRKAQRWAADSVSALRGAEPAIPQGLNDRQQDNWSTMIAIADLAGDEWPVIARKAAIELSADAEDNDELKVRLLADVRALFTEGTEKMTSAGLAAELARDEAGPWVVYGKTQHPISQHQLARLLHDFEIYPKGIRIGVMTLRGYERSAFEDAWSRYLPSSDRAPFELQQCNKPAKEP